MAQSSEPVHDLPALDGKLLLDNASLEGFADDWGHYIQRRPLAVLKPGSVQNVVTMVRFANQRCLLPATASRFAVIRMWEYRSSIDRLM